MSLKHDAQMTRRSFSACVLMTSAGVALTGITARDQQQPDKNQSQSLLAYPPLKIEGAERVLPGSFLYFDYPKAGNAAVLVRTMDGHYLAYSRKCAHLGCSVDYDRTSRCLSCPCHRGVYDGRTGYVMLGPPPRPLDQIILQMRAGGEVWAVGKRPGGDSNV